MNARFKVAVRAHDHVGGDSGSAQCLLADPAGPCFWCDPIRDHDQQVVVAVRAVVASRPGTE